MFVTKVASFLQTNTLGLEHSMGTELVAALRLLHRQVPKNTRFSYISHMYLPFFLVHATPGQSLLISGISSSDKEIRHAAPPTHSEIQTRLRIVHKLENVPDILRGILERIQTKPEESIILRNVIHPGIVGRIQQLVNPSLAEPGNEEIADSILSTAEIHDMGSTFRVELTRIEKSMKEIKETLIRIDGYSEKQLRLLDETRQALHSSTLGQATPTSKATASTDTVVDEATQQLEGEKQQISQKVSQILGSIEETLKFSAEQCRRLIGDIRAKPSELERVLVEVKNQLVRLQTTSNEFSNLLQQGLTELNASFSQLQAAEQRWLWSRSQTSGTAPTPPEAPVTTPADLLKETTDAVETSPELIELDSLRERIIKCYWELKQAVKSIETTIIQQHQQFSALSTPAVELQGPAPITRVLVPIFLVKLLEGSIRYGVVSPLKINPISPNNPVVEVFDTTLNTSLQQLVRSEISDPHFSINIDQQALALNALTHVDSKAHIEHGIKQFVRAGLLDTEAINNLNMFWSSIAGRCPFCGAQTPLSQRYCGCGKPIHGY